MNTEKKESYVQPALVKHKLLRDITANSSAYGSARGGSSNHCRFFCRLTH